MLSNNFILLAMPQNWFRIFLELRCFQCCKIFKNLVYNVLCYPCPAPGQALLRFHKNCCSSSTSRAQRRSSSGTVTSQRAPHCPLRWLPNMRRCTLVSAARSARHPVRTARHQARVAWHPSRATRHQCAWPGTQRVRPCIQLARPGIKLARPSTQCAHPDVNRPARHQQHAYVRVCAKPRSEKHDCRKSMTVTWHNVSSSRTPSLATSEGAPGKQKQNFSCDQKESRRQMSGAQSTGRASIWHSLMDSRGFHEAFSNRRREELKNMIRMTMNYENNYNYNNALQYVTIYTMKNFNTMKILL